MKGERIYKLTLLGGEEVVITATSYPKMVSKAMRIAEKRIGNERRFKVMRVEVLVPDTMNEWAECSKIGL